MLFICTFKYKNNDMTYKSMGVWGIEIGIESTVVEGLKRWLDL